MLENWQKADFEKISVRRALEDETYGKGWHDVWRRNGCDG